MDIRGGIVVERKSKWRTAVYDHRRTVLESLLEEAKRRRSEFWITTAKEASEDANAMIKRRKLLAEPVTPDSVGRTLGILGFQQIERTVRAARWMIPKAQVLELYQKASK